MISSAFESSETLATRGKSLRPTRWSAMNQLLSTSAPAVQAPLDLYAPILRDLEEVERVLARSLKSRRACVNELVAHLSHFRGKRLRPALLLLTARACGRVTPDHHVLGAVVEMVHTATLVHD